MANKGKIETANRGKKLNGKPCPVRDVTRCTVCGRPKAVLKKYGICRICFREKALAGELPGVKKSSW